MIDNLKGYRQQVKQFETVLHMLFLIISIVMNNFEHFFNFGVDFVDYLVENSTLAEHFFK
jgi:hypothetical protein